LSHTGEKSEERPNHSVVGVQHHSYEFFTAHIDTRIHWPQSNFEIMTGHRIFARIRISKI